MDDPRTRAKKLLIAGIIGSHLAGIVTVVTVFLFGTRLAGLSALLGAGLVLAFFAIGQGVQVHYADADPSKTMIATLGSYLLRVLALGALFAVHLTHPGLLDGKGLGIGVIGTVLGWLTAVLWQFSRLRILVFDPPETSILDD